MRRNDVFRKFKKDSNSISCTIILGAFMSLVMGFPLSTGAGVAIGELNKTIIKKR